MRDRGTRTLTTAHEQGWALGAFSTCTQEITQAICRAAQDAGQPEILRAGASAFSHAGMAELAAQAVVAADLATAELTDPAPAEQCAARTGIETCPAESSRPTAVEEPQVNRGSAPDEPLNRLSMT